MKVKTPAAPTPRTCRRCRELQRMASEWCDRAAATEITEANVKLAVEAVTRIRRLQNLHVAAAERDQPGGVDCFHHIDYYNKSYSYSRFQAEVDKVLGEGTFPELDDL